MVKIKKNMQRKDGSYVDFLAKPTLLEFLKKLGLDQGFVSSEIIYERIKLFPGIRFRINRLKNQGYLICQKGQKDGNRGRPNYEFRLSSKSLAYSQKYGSFLNEKGYLIRKDKIKNPETFNSNLTEKEQEVEDFFEKESSRVKIIKNKKKEFFE